jgi:hypothetical protein
MGSTMTDAELCGRHQLDFPAAQVMPPLSIAVVHQEIVVSKPSSELSVTYRREGRVLIADDALRTDPRPEKLNFLVQAWKAAFAKAQSLGWLY